MEPLDERTHIHDKRTLLFIIDYNQDYLLKYITPISSDVNLYFIHYASPKERKSNSFLHHGKIIYWKDFKHASHLISLIKPLKVVFFELETLNQVALNAVCKSKGIKTIFCDHGLSMISSTVAIDTEKKRNRIKFNLHKYLRFPIDRIKNRLFFNRTCQASNKEVKKFLKKYKEIRLSNTIYQTFMKISNEQLRPSEYYSISPKNHEFHQYLDNNANIPVRYFGLLDFDQMTSLKEDQEKKYVLYVDQPYAKMKLFGWNNSRKKKWIESINNWCQLKGLQLIIKKHPREDRMLWDSIKNDNIKYPQDEYVDYLPNTSIVIGFNSTLLASLAAIQHLALFCVYRHPDGSTNEIDFFVKEGIADWVTNIEDLSEEIILNTISKQQKNKSVFRENWLYNTDEKASDRLKALYLSE